MELNRNKKRAAIFIITTAVIILGTVFYLTAIKYKTGDVSKGKKIDKTDLSPTPKAQAYNPAEKLPDTNPYDAKTNPFEEAETNPFKDVYKNPFSK